MVQHLHGNYQPGTGTVRMSFRNVGEATGNYGRESNTQSEIPNC